MRGHRTIRSQQAKEIHYQPRRFLTVTVQAETAQRAWEENEVRFLTEAHSVVSYLTDGSVWSDWFLPGLSEARLLTRRVTPDDIADFYLADYEDLLVNR